MRFTMAVPTLLLDKLEPLQDLQFCLAQHCKDDKYAEWFHKQRAKGEIVIMDNGFHETGAPLAIPELIMYAEKVKPNFLISPDWLGFPKKTYEAYVKMQRAKPSGVKLAVVLQGQNPVELYEFFEAVRPTADMVCFPFRADRVSWFKELLQRVPKHMKWPPYIHLLGVKTLDELVDWRNLIQANSIPHHVISVDTTKPIKYGIDLKAMDGMDNWRGNGGWPQVDAPASIDAQQLSMIYYNVAYLRRFL